MADPSASTPEDSTIDKVTLGMFVASLERRRDGKDAKPASDGKQRVRLVMQVDPLWLGRLQVQAERLGLTLAAYVSQAATRRLEGDEANDPNVQRKLTLQKKRKGTT